MRRCACGARIVNDGDDRCTRCELLDRAQGGHHVMSTELEFTQYTADDVQEAAEEMCRRTHGGVCIPWGQARILFQHGPGAAGALSTVGPIIDRYVIPGFER